jgi:hypothetical protein
MVKREHISNMYATNHSDNTLKGMKTLKEEISNPMDLKSTRIDEDSERNNQTYRTYLALFLLKLQLLA